MEKDSLPRRIWIHVAVVITAGLLVGAGAGCRRQQEKGRPAERHYLAGLESARAGKEQQAVSEWNMAIAMNPADPRPYDALATYWEATDRPDLAAQTMERLARANPKAAHRDCRFARAAFAAGWITRAGEAIERALREEPDCPTAHTMRGIIRADAGDWTAALAALKRALELAPQDVRIALTLAQVEGRAGQRAAAVHRVKHVLEHDPESLQAHYLLGWLQATTSSPTPATDAEAEQHLQKVLAEDKEHAGARAELGALYTRQKQFDRARPLLEAARTQDPTDPDVARSLARVYAGLGDPQAARLSAEAQRLEDLQQRRNTLRQRHLRQPADASVTLQLARVELAAGQTQEANDLVRQLLAADPNNRAALDLLHQIMGTPEPEPAP